MKLTRTTAINEEYPIYESIDGDGVSTYMWWMWHDTVGHWVVNKTPGVHGHDLLKSTFGAARCPNEPQKGWEGIEDNVVCGCHVECPGIIIRLLVL
ncbi:unnamed protein product [Oikopleura dioica]|uniref:Uncharacterized protein n=1 Tax=Oikopleura dioica TaxID=34765 RepID=E4XV11_OIKDI|nr:unnamed protein product [Oikopleura dioica]